MKNTFLQLTVSALLGLFFTQALVVFLSISGAYLISNIVATLYYARNDVSSLRYLPVIFAILHVSYGLGFLIGLVKFAHRWMDKSGAVPAFSHDS